MNNKNIDLLINNFLRKAKQAVKNNETIEFREGFLRNIVNKPINFTTGNPYRDSNATMLWLNFGANAKVATFNQIKNAGGHVKAGAKGVKLHNSHYEDIVEHDDELDEDVVVGSRLITTYFNVFSINDVEGITLPEEDTTSHVVLSRQSNDFIDDICRRLGVRLETTNGRPDVDVERKVIKLPSDDRWLSEKDRFYTTIEKLSYLKLAQVESRLSSDYQNIINSLVAASISSYFGYEDEENSLGFLTSFIKKVETNATFLPAVLNQTFRIVDDFVGSIQN